MSPTTQGPTTDYSTFTINPTITSTIMESTTSPCKMFFCFSKKNLIFFFLGDTCCPCTNITVYSECNIGNPEIGTFNNIGKDEFGKSLYKSYNNSDYQLYYDTTNNVN